MSATFEVKCGGCERTASFTVHKAKKMEVEIVPEGMDRETVLCDVWGCICGKENIIPVMVESA